MLQNYININSCIFRSTQSKHTEGTEAFKVAGYEYFRRDIGPAQYNEIFTKI